MSEAIQKEHPRTSAVDMPRLDSVSSATVVETHATERDSTATQSDVEEDEPRPLSPDTTMVETCDVDNDATATQSDVEEDESSLCSPTTVVDTHDAERDGIIATQPDVMPSVELFSPPMVVATPTVNRDEDATPMSSSTPATPRPVLDLFGRPIRVAPSTIPELSDITAEDMFAVGRHLAQQPKLASLKSDIEAAMNVARLTPGARQMLSVNNSIRKKWCLCANDLHSIRDLCRHLGLSDNKGRNGFIGAIFFHTTHVGLSVIVERADGKSALYEVAPFVPWLRKTSAIFDILFTIQPQLCESICRCVVPRNRC